jgi:hypothetical protein
MPRRGFEEGLLAGRTTLLVSAHVSQEMNQLEPKKVGLRSMSSPKAAKNVDIREHDQGVVVGDVQQSLDEQRIVHLRPDAVARYHNVIAAARNCREIMNAVGNKQVCQSENTSGK